MDVIHSSFSLLLLEKITSPPPKKKALRKTLKDFTQLLRDFSDTVVSVQGHYSLVLAYLHIESDFSQATPAWLFNRFTTIIKLNLN